MPKATQRPRMATGSPTSRASVYGLRKTPLPIVIPTTSATPPPKPTTRFRSPPPAGPPVMARDPTAPGAQSIREQLQSAPVPSDPYRLPPEDVADPPHGLAPTLRPVRPRPVLAGPLAGPGAVIATPTPRAQARYPAPRVVLPSP